jgi:hypothetical protein
MAHGSTYPSYDVDIAYDRSRGNLERLVAALEEIGVSLRGTPRELPFQLDAQTLENGANFTFVTPSGDFDVLADMGGIKSYDELRAAAEQKEVAGVTVRVASLDHLIAMKRAAGRVKDRLMVEEYVALADELRRMRTEPQAE